MSEHVQRREAVVLSMHVAETSCTVLLLPPSLARSFTILLLRPLRRMLATEVLRLSHLMAELPKELAIEEAVVALVEEMVSTGQDDNLIEITGEQGASQEARDEVTCVAHRTLPTFTAASCPFVILIVT